MSDTIIKPENGHGAADGFPGEDFAHAAKPLSDRTSDRTPEAERDDDASHASSRSEESDASDTSDASDLPADDEVPNGTVLDPGYHLFEVATALPCKQDILLAGLARIGIASVRLDQSRARSAAQLAVREHRFLAHVTKPLVLHQERAALRWLFAQPLFTDVTGDVRKFRMKLEAYALEPGAIYEALFLSRERSQPTRQIVEEHLNDMGFIIHALTCIQRDMRLPDRPGVSTALWFGVLEWDAPASVVTEDDPFYFESLLAPS